MGAYRGRHRPFWAQRGRRFLLPVAVLLLGWWSITILLSILIREPFPLARFSGYRPFLNALAALRFLLLLFSTFFVYPFLWVQRAPLGERLIAAFALPLSYVVWAGFQATAYFPLAEALYYGFNPLAFGAFWLQWALIGIAEIAGRSWNRHKHGAPGPVVRWPHIAGIVVGLTALYLTLFWDGGVHWFYIYQEGYKLLFR